MQRESLVLNVYVNEVELPLDRLVLGGFASTSNVGQLAPAADLVFTDSKRLIKDKFTLADGLDVRVNIGTTIRNSKTYNYRIFKVVETTTPSGIRYRLILCFSNSKYWQGTVTQHFSGTSKAAIEFIAGQNNITVEADPTSDTQIWYGLKERWCTWAHKISKVAYIDDTGGFLIGLTMSGKLRFKNVAAYKYSEGLPLFTQGSATTSDQFIPILSHKVVNVSGYNNNNYVYHGATLSQTIIGDSAVKHDKVKKVKGTKKLAVNTDVKQQLSSGQKVRFSNIDSGNTHANYQKAEYQNARLLGTHSNQLHVLSNVVTDIDLLDQCRSRIYDLPLTGPSQLNADYSGYYFVIGKTIYVGPDLRYLEKFILVADGKNQDKGKTGKLV